MAKTITISGSDYATLEAYGLSELSDDILDCVEYRNERPSGYGDDGDDTTRADRLTEAAHAFGESQPYVGDDGKLYV